MTEQATNTPAGTEGAPAGGEDAAAIAAAAALAAKGEEEKQPDVPLDIDEDEDKDVPDGVIAYNPTGDVGLDMALEFVGKHGYSPDHPAMKAAINGDFSLLEAELAGKDIKGYGPYIKLAEKAFKDISAKTQAKQAADKEAVHKAVGGEERWGEIQAWAATAADETEKPAIQAALSKGGIDAQMAATWLAVNFDRANGAKDTEGSGPSVADTAGKPSGSNDALSPQDYGRAVAKARQEHKGREPFESSKAYTDLRARRERFRG